jgi:hypothetical protein
MSFIVPISLPATPRMKVLRNILFSRQTNLFIANFADRPGTVFSGVHQKVSVFISRKDDDLATKLYSTNFLHWYSKNTNNERDHLMQSFAFQENGKSTENWLKIGNKIELSIIDKLRSDDNLNILFVKKSKNSALLNMRMMFWGKCFTSAKSSNEYKTFYFDTIVERDNFVASMNSSLFFYFWETVSDCWHITNQELSEFRLSLKKIEGNDLSNLAKELESDLEAKKGYVGSVQTEYEYYHKKSKPIIDEIDRVLAKHYGFTEEEFDFIVNYDIKYRMGGELEDGEE